MSIVDAQTDCVVVMSRLNAVVMTQQERQEARQEVLRILEVGKQRAEAVYSEHYDEAEQYVSDIALVRKNENERSE